jgi:hypothetical protein
VLDKLIEAPGEPTKGKSLIVDALSLYLNISQDIQKDPNKIFFIYQVVDKKGVNEREFTIEGFETIVIDDKEFETIRIACPELRLIFYVSKEHNFMPVYINKTNGRNNYRLALKEYNQ